MARKKKASQPSPRAKSRAPSEQRRTAARPGKVLPDKTGEDLPASDARMDRLKTLLEAAASPRLSDRAMDKPIDPGLTIRDLLLIKLMVSMEARRPDATRLQELCRLLFGPQQTDGLDAHWPSLFVAREGLWESFLRYVALGWGSSLSVMKRIPPVLKAQHKLIGLKNATIARQTEHFLRQYEDMESELKQALKDVYMPVKKAIALWAKVCPKESPDYNKFNKARSNNPWIRFDRKAPKSRPRVHRGDWIRFLLSPRNPDTFELLGQPGADGLTSIAGALTDEDLADVFARGKDIHDQKQRRGK